MRLQSFYSTLYHIPQTPLCQSQTVYLYPRALFFHKYKACTARGYAGAPPQTPLKGMIPLRILNWGYIFCHKKVKPGNTYSVSRAYAIKKQIWCSVRRQLLSAATGRPGYAYRVGRAYLPMNSINIPIWRCPEGIIPSGEGLGRAAPAYPVPPRNSRAQSPTGMSGCTPSQRHRRTVVSQSSPFLPW